MRKQTVLGVVVSVLIIVVSDRPWGFYLMVTLRTVENAMGKEESSRGEGETSFVLKRQAQKKTGRQPGRWQAAKTRTNRCRNII